MKKIISILLIAILCVALFAACTQSPAEQKPEDQTPADSTPQEPPLTLSAPTGLQMSEDGLITWNAVDGATGYVVTIAGSQYTTAEARFQVTALNENFDYSVVATAGDVRSASSAVNHYVAPIITPPVPPVSTKTVAISGGAEVKSGGTLPLSALITGTEIKAVSWEITAGEDYATVDELGVVHAAEVTEDRRITVRVSLDEDESVFAEKTISVVARSVLTQAMLDELAAETRLSFEGYISIDLYDMGPYPKLQRNVMTNVATAMDGTHWYTNYESGDGIPMSLYYANHEGVACQVGLSFYNDEIYVPMQNDDGSVVSWKDSGMYNNFAGLSVEDFTFDEDEWRWMYTGADSTLLTRMIASANPYDFVPLNLGLIIEDGELMGIYSAAADSYSLVAGYTAKQYLYASINVGDVVEVPTVAKYDHEAVHDDLSAAIANMQALSSYKVDFVKMEYSIYTASMMIDGFTEYITDGLNYFVPFVKSAYLADPTYDYAAAYGYKRITDDLYNGFYRDGNAYFASRAYERDFAAASPSWGFAAEIFRKVETDTEGTKTYYVDQIMCPVASTFYYGLGNDIALYGIYAAEGNTGSRSFTPYVTVKDGYIVAAGFYYYLGYMYGVVELTYSDFNATELPQSVGTVDFAVRQVPQSWSELSMYGEDADGNEIETNCADYIEGKFGEKTVPFFGAALGDTYGFAMNQVYITGAGQSVPAMLIYYDVPLDTDYSINSSLAAIADQLLSLGFVKNAYGEYEKDGLSVIAVDNNLDLHVYVWNTRANQ